MIYSGSRFIPLFRPPVINQFLINWVREFPSVWHDFSVYIHQRTLLIPISSLNHSEHKENVWFRENRRLYQFRLKRMLQPCQIGAGKLLRSDWLVCLKQYLGKFNTHANKLTWPVIEALQTLITHLILELLKYR